MRNLLTNKEKGITLMEILLGLVIAGIMISMILRLYLDQYGLTTEVMSKSESRFAVFRGAQVITSALTKAEKADWINGNALQVVYSQGDELIMDYFYLEDKDADGRMDLYRKHRGVSNPVVTGITDMNLKECSDGLWEIRLVAGQRGQISIWQGKVRQRLCRP